MACASTAFAAKDTAFWPVLPLPSRPKTPPSGLCFHCLRDQRHRLLACASTAYAAEDTAFGFAVPQVCLYMSQEGTLAISQSGQVHSAPQPSFALSSAVPQPRPPLAHPVESAPVRSGDEAARTLPRRG